jgi:RimJ/RimL family protein N-acetyltransferase
MVVFEAAAPGQIVLAQLERSDCGSLLRFFYRLSPDSLYRRFLAPIARPSQARPERLLDVDHKDREALVSLVDGEIVGVARYIRASNSDEADLAVVVADGWQRRGLATRMLDRLDEAACRAGIRRFRLTMHADNRPILSLVRKVYPTARLELHSGVLEGTVALPRDVHRLEA